MKNKSLYLFILIAVIIVAAGLIVVFYANKNADREQSKSPAEQGEVAGATTQEDDYAIGLAKFMTEKGMVMYGADWCAHCKSQKELFGNAFQFVDYVECDASGPNANPDECAAKGIEGYPTWIYNGEKISGEKTLSELAEIVGYKSN